MIKLNDSREIADPWDELAMAIINQAVEDWRRLISAKKHVLWVRGQKISLMEIRQFFRSDYCQLLVGADPEIILSRLEKELDESRKSERRSSDCNPL